LWALGYPDQALKRSREALALAQELSHPFTLAFALGLSAAFHYFRREVIEAYKQAEATIAISSQKGFPFWGSVGKVMRGWALAHQINGEEEQAEIREGIAFARGSGARQPLPTWLIAFADACAQWNSVEEGLNHLAEAQAEITESGAGIDEAEIHRLRGDLLLQTDVGKMEVEACLLQAVEIARHQQAKSWELRATLCLCRLWQRQGRYDEARQWLTEIYEWFTEGFDTPDLEETSRLLDELI
jgi:adenylate cyclase